jgi:signal transduction histidine kinase
VDRPASLAAFIRRSRVEIVDRFEAFARTFSVVAAGMTARELQDHASDLLTAIANDLESAQTVGEQLQKSEGHGSAHAMEASGLLHADARIGHGFSLAQVLAEFRALRASVLSLYDGQDGPIDLAGIRRFNEAIDEALTSSIVRFSERLTVYSDQFIGMLGHDLRSPLSAITSGATLLTMPAEVDPQQRPRVAELILRSAHRMEGMIADLLDLTRSRLGTGIPVRLAQADLDAICAHAILEVQAGNPANVITYQSVGDLRGDWDTPRLMQVVINLLTNALEHGAGSPVRVHADGMGDGVRIRVSNGGIAIPRELLQFIFEPLVRQSPAGGRAEGLGLGLFIVRAIVTAHHGTVDVTSNEREGTTFDVHLPRTPNIAAVG